MRKILTSMMILLALLVIVGCKGDKNGDKEPADVKLEGVTVSLQGVEANKDFEIVDFYLQRNTDFNLHIYLENELDLDITKIKINNTEYTSDDFLEGSSNTFITLSFNTQNNTGKNDYKINGITYLKASDERQADIEDNDLVSIYVQSRFIPVANVSNINADVLSINLNIAISDREGLIDMQNGDAVFLLFEEGVEILSEQLTYNNEIELVNLKPDQQYTYKIQAIFDESDGEGLNERVLLEGNLKTIQPINVRVHAPVETEISFDYSVLNESITIDKIDLELDGEFE